MPLQLAFSADRASATKAAAVAQACWPNPATTGWDGARATTGLACTFAQDQEIYGEGDAADLFFKVLSGVVRTCKFQDDGCRQIDAFYVAGEVFGVDADACYRRTAEAVSDCTLMPYRRRGLEGLAANDDILAAQVFAYAMRSMSRAQDHALLLGRRCAVEKVTAFLKEWARHAPGERTIALAMSRRDIADYLGLTIESVSRALSQLQRDAVIELPSARRIRFTHKAAC